MATNRTRNDGRKPPYIHPLIKDEACVQLSCRIPVGEKDRIDNAVRLLRECGEDMQIVDIVRKALADAAEYVERHYSKAKAASATSASQRG